MSLTRKFLTAMGIEAEKIDQIIEAHTETVDALKTARDQYKAEAEKLPAVQKELDDLKKESFDGDTSYKAKYEKEHTDFEQYKSDQTAKETKAKKTEAYKNLLKEAGISDKHIDSVLRVSDVDSIEFDDKGAVKDSKTMIGSIKKDWSDFITTNGKQGAKTSTPPHTDDSKNHGTGRGAELAKKYMSAHGEKSNDNNGGE